MFSRYAIYVTPPPGIFADLGAQWLGWDAATAQTCPHPEMPGALDQITAQPRRYGLHGTMKPPFRLAPGFDLADLIRATDAFCASQSALTLGPLVPREIGQFLALVPSGDTAALDALAAATVAALDPFRAPATAADLARRRANATLTPAQDQLLIQWGYPYVMEEFRFHLTLTGSCDAAKRAALVPQIHHHFAPVLDVPFRVGDLTILGEDAEGRFRHLHRAVLAGPA
ncbi:DUF1045 domain-containing protein [Pseudoruegeria sp. SK021]|uniref:DUF1045 domain-containing protein n=1 Tax=Pseudoruegeria sp. SK021 TaxID=1933035 RepID=UPI000A218237|nr:DUF1045 domain-containing protein [Pseudoruegeria sp. SK021]OSP55978.1 hypothetical protein BV911_04850 [Pseudoruegeria sp. SK021]